MSAIIFQLRKYLTLLYVVVRSGIAPWKKIEGVFLPVRTNIGFNTLRWILNGKYEQGEINIIKNRTDANDTVLEIGTGLGFVASYCAKRIGSNKVYTYEANITNIPVIETVFKKNKVALF